MKPYNMNIMRDIFNKAVKLHDGDEAQARAWMGTGHPEFNGYSPLSYCKPYSGAEKVEAFLDKKLQEKFGVR